MTETKKYHYRIGFPRDVSTKFGVLTLSYSQHAKQAARDDRYASTIALPLFLNTDAARAIEVEVEGGSDELKVLYRVPYDARHDLCLVVLPASGFVKTVWLNEKRDQHRNLRREEYDVPAKMAA